MTRVGLISGSGAYDWPGLLDPTPRRVDTRHGAVEVTEGRVAGVDVVHLSRHGAGHARLSHQVAHRANLAALVEAEVDAIVSLTVCGAVDPGVPLGSVVVFDDLHFPSNRLPDGSPCTWFDEPGAAGRGHWIFDRPFAASVRTALIEGAEVTGTTAVTAGCYGHVDGPRFNSRAEIASLAGVGVTAVSQTAGPEVVLAGEAEIPLGLLGFVTDYANGVAPEPEPVDALLERMRHSATVFATVVEATLPRLADPSPPGVVYRFG